MKIRQCLLLCRLTVCCHHHESPLLDPPLNQFIPVLIFAADFPVKELDFNFSSKGNLCEL
jgi:hypothetical protein